MSTPIRAGLTATSSLRPLVEDGVQALLREHRGMITEDIRSSFTDSLDIDDGLKKGREQENRWDYLLGHEPSQTIVAIEPHSAKNDQISTVIAKRRRALDQLRDHLRPGVAVLRWYWVASGRVDFSPLDKATFRLANNGITFIGRALRRKDLPGVDASAPVKKVRRRR